MKTTRLIAALSVSVLPALMASPASAALRALLPNEEIIYQSVQSGPSYRTNFNQVTGNAYTHFGDEVFLGGTNRYLTNIAVGTQTYQNAATPPYMDGVNQGAFQPGYEDTGGMLEMAVYINDGPPDLAGDGAAVESTPDGQLQPGTLIATSRIPTPTYPAGGVGRTDANVNDFVLNFPFNNVLIPAVAANRITFAIINLNAAGQPDGLNSDGNQWGVWLSQASSSNVDPDSNPLTFNNNTTYNTATVGTSRTGPVVSAVNNGQWNWVEYPAKTGVGLWENSRDANLVMDATIYASSVPEPTALGFLTIGVGASMTRRRLRRNA